MAPAVSSKEVPKSIIRQAFSMSLGTFSSRILGLIRDMALAALFPRSITDAWTAAFRLPNLFRRLLGEGSLSVSFIPVFVEARIDSEARAANLVNGFYTLLLVFLAILTALGILLAEPIMGLLLDSGYGAEKLAMTVRMAQVMFGFVFFVTTYAYFMGILNALGKFGLPAMAPTLFNISMILSTLMPDSWFTYEGDGLAWGVLIGGALQMGLLIPALRRLGAMPRLQWVGISRDIRKVLTNMLPGLLGMGLLQFVTIVNLKYASRLGEGSISYIYWADRLLELPLSLVAVSIGTALLPTLAELWSHGRREEMAETVNYHLRLNFFIAVPAALGLFALARPIVEVLFMRGQFNSADAEATAAVLRVYAWLLLATSGVRVLVPAYYATQNTRLPAIAAAVSLTLHILLAPQLMKSWGLEGLVISSLLSAVVNMVILLLAYKKSIGEFNFSKFTQQTFKFTLAGLVMTIVLQLHPVLQSQFAESVIVKILVLAVMIVAGVATYLGMSSVLKLEELQALKKVKSRF